MTIFNRREAAPFTTADGSTIREFLNAGNSPLRNQSLAEATLEPGQATTEHYHPRAEEIYFILEGRGTMRIEGETREVEPGDAIAIPNGLRHKIWNSGAETLRFLCCCSPAYSHQDTVLTEES
jgi:mannose-6-phosphate isomerase-like protein (cupin superfamily)